MNPLKEKLQDNKLQDLAEESGLSRNTIRAISRMTLEELGGIRLKNYIAIKNKLGVDLLVWNK